MCWRVGARKNNIRSLLGGKYVFMQKAAYRERFLRRLRNLCIQLVGKLVGMNCVVLEAPGG